MIGDGGKFVPHWFLKKSVQKVISSYKNKKNYSRSNQIIVQAQIKDVSMSGVLFTYEMNTGAPYYVINYDDTSNLTNAVTSGGKTGGRVLNVLNIKYQI